MDLTVDQIVRGVEAPRSAVEKHFDSLLEALEENSINTPLRIAHFLAQCSHESGGFLRTEENLNYSWERLLAVFPRYFRTAEDAKAYNRQPRQIASRVYANRMGNGDEASEDGWYHRGAGCIQLTGKNNQSAYWRARGGDEPFDRENIVAILKAPPHAMRTAGWFWSTNGLNTFADRDDVLAVSGKINVGNANASENQIVGYAERVRHTEAMKQELGV